MFHIQQYQSAVYAFKKSIVLKEQWKSYQGLGVSLGAIGQYQQAVNAFTKSIALKEQWKSYQGLGLAFHNIGKYQPAVDAFKRSLALKEQWQSYQGLGWALFKLGQNQQAVSAFKKAIAYEEVCKSYQGLGYTLNKLGEEKEAIEAFQNIYVRGGCPHIKTNPFLVIKGGFAISKDQIEAISDNLSKIQFAFYPSYLSEIGENKELQSWRYLIHIHIPKCAGVNFERPLSELPFSLNRELKSNRLVWSADSQYKQYFWHGNLGG